MIADTKLMITLHTGIPARILNCTTKYLVPGTWYLVLVPVMSKGTWCQVQQMVLMVMLMSDVQTFMIRYWLCTRC